MTGDASPDHNEESDEPRSSNEVAWIQIECVGRWSATNSALDHSFSSRRDRCSDMPQRPHASLDLDRERLRGAFCSPEQNEEFVGDMGGHVEPERTAERGHDRRGDGQPERRDDCGEPNEMSCRGRGATEKEGKTRGDAKHYRDLYDESDRPRDQQAEQARAHRRPPFFFACAINFASLSS